MELHTLPRRQLRAGIYGRASSDPKKRGRSIKDQFAVAELDCQELNFSVVGYYEDRDRSASRRATKTREDYERLVADAGARHIDVIVYAERSRANRNMDSFVKLRQLCEDTGVLLCYGGRIYDMRKPADRRDATRDAVASEEEAEAIIERAERTARLNARRGAPHGIVPFGYVRRYDPDDGHLIGQFAHPQNSAIVRTFFQKAAANESISSIWIEARRHLPTLSRRGLRQMLRNKAYIGIRTHRGVEMPECQWDGIVEDHVFWKVQSILDDPERHTVRDFRAKHLLSGLAVCAECIAGGRRVQDSRLFLTIHRGKARYRCPLPAGHAMAAEAVVDAYVRVAVFTWLASKQAAAAFEARADDGEAERLRGRIGNIQAQLDDARRLAGELDDDGVPRLSVQSLAATESQLLPILARDEQRLREITSVRDPLLGRLVGMPVELIARCWDEELDVSQRRHVLRTVVNVELRRSPVKGAQKFDPARIGLVFASESGFRPWVGREAKSLGGQDEVVPAP